MASIALADQIAVATSGTWKDANGVELNPLHQEKGQIATLIFIRTDCPIANVYAPEIKRIVEAYSAKHIAFNMVYVDSGITPKAAKDHARAYGYRCPAILDPLHTLAFRAGATATPEVVVVGPKGSIVYRGRIDDRAVDFGKFRSSPKRQDLRLTLDAILQGKPVPLARTPCVGCIISAPDR